MLSEDTLRACRDVLDEKLYRMLNQLVDIVGAGRWDESAMHTARIERVRLALEEVKDELAKIRSKT